MIRPHPLIPAGTVATLDRLFTGLRQDTCVIERPSTSRDAGGAPVGTMTVTGGFPCTVRRPGRVGTERTAGARFGPDVDYEVLFDREVQVTTDDDLVVMRTGTRLRVVSVPDAESYGLQMIVGAKVAG